MSWLKNFVLLSIVFDVILAKMQQNFLELSFDDILNEKLMPSALMLAEGTEGGEGEKERENMLWRNPSSSRKLDDEFECVTKKEVKKDGAFSNAFNAMRYHRKMINEFMCSNFIADKILEDLQPALMKNRLGLASQESANSSSNSDTSLRKRMLFDVGSYQYKNWLTKCEVTIQHL